MVNPASSRNLNVADGSKLLIESYLAPNNPPITNIHDHPLLPSLSDRSQENRELRQNVIKIIANTPLQSTVRGEQSVEKRYMGTLMLQKRGKVDVNLAR